MTHQNADASASDQQPPTAGPGAAGGYPTLYSAELAERILHEVEAGRSLHDVCGDADVPAYSTVKGWVSRDHEGFAARYYRARETGQPRHGGPLLYTAEIAQRILHELSEGRTLHDICRDDTMPASSTVQLWVSEDREGFAARYAGACRVGRPKIRRTTLYTLEVAEWLLLELAEGRALRDICRDEGMPAHSTVRLWVIEDREGFAARYRRAREFGYHAMTDEILEIVDDGRNDWIARRMKDGTIKYTLNREHVSRSRLRYDARRWMQTNSLPKIFGDRPDPDVNADDTGSWAALLKAVDGKSRGLPNRRLSNEPTVHPQQRLETG